MDIDFELYKIFYHVAAAESFSGAAEKLYISQSAVSQAIKGLEGKLGVRLFFRKTRSIKLTGEGEILFRHIEQAYNFIKTGEGKILDMQNMDSGEIRLGVSDTICKYFLIPYLEKFSLKYPKVKIQVVNRTSPQILDILKNGLIDLGIVTLPLEDSSIAVDEFMSVEDIFVASTRYEDLKNRELSVNELLEYPLLMLPQNSSTRRNLDSFINRRGYVITPEVELENMDILVEFARIGLGIAYVLRESAANAMLNGELFEVKLNTKLPIRKLGIATMTGIPLAHAANEFIKHLKGAD